MAKKALSIKSIYKTINDYGKNLSSSSIYLIEDNKLLSSSLKEKNETFHITQCILDDDYKEYLNYLGITVDGSSLGPVIGGTGFEGSIDEGFLKCSSYKSKGKNKDKEEIKWEVNYTCNSKERYEILKNISKLDRIYGLDKKYQNDYYSMYEYDIEKLLNDKKFIIDISEKLSVKSLKITNKMIKILNKDTEYIRSYISYPILGNEDNTLKRLHIIESKQKHALIISYYVFIDS